jgi:hypothetical protein
MTNSIDSYTKKLTEFVARLFNKLLVDHSTDAATWTEFCELLDRHTLLEYRVPSLFSPKPYEVDNSRLEDARYRRITIRKLRAPRPSKWMNVHLNPDRVRVAGDEAYRIELSELMSAKWVDRLVPIADLSDVVVLFKADPAFLLGCLKELRLNDIDSDGLVDRYLRMTVEEVLDSSPAMNRLIDDFKKETSVIVAESCAAIREITAHHIAESRAAFDRIIEDIRRM